jgi:hypothetical protein
MSANPAPQVRRAMAPAVPQARPVQPQQSVRARQSEGFAFAAAADHEDEFRVNLSDIPRQHESMEVEGFKPSLLSRLFSLIAPLK